MCGLRTRPRIDIDPPRVKLTSPGDIYLLATPGTITCCIVLCDSRRDVAHKKIKEVFYKAIKMRKDSGEHEDDMLQTLIDTPYK